MTIKKVLNLATEDIDQLVNTGMMLGSINKGFDNNEFEEIENDQFLELINGISDVILRIVAHMNPRKRKVATQISENEEN